MSEKATHSVEGQPTEVLAGLFDCTTRQVELLAKRGIVVRVGRGRYDLTRSTRNYIKHLREQAAARVGQDPNKDGVAANVSYKNASTELLRLRIEKEAGSLIAADDARNAWGAILRQVRQAWMALPGKIAFEIATLTAHDRKTMERIVREDLEDVAMGRGFVIAKQSIDVPDQQTGA